MKINQAMIESYVRNLIGQVIGAATVVAAATHVSIACLNISLTALSSAYATITLGP